MAVDTFKKYLKENNIEVEVIETSEPTKTAVDAAKVHGVPVCNIVKSLLLKVDDNFKLFLVPGDRRLDIENLKTKFNTSNIRMANADEVKEITGYSIGGVPPFGHKNNLETYIEEGFDIDTNLVAAAGSGNSVFSCNFNAMLSYVHQNLIVRP